MFRQRRRKKIITPEQNPPPHAAVLYLSPMLERRAVDIVVAVVAHEFAHIVLRHILFFLTPDEYDRQEQEVFSRIREWGFENEARKHAVLRKRRGW